MTQDEPTKQSLIAALYGRTSTGNQEEEKTIDSQVAEVEERIKSDSNIIATENKYTDDGWTGTTLERPALDRMLNDAKAGKFQVLYIYDLGRIARKYHLQKIVLEELEEAGVKLISLHDRNVETEEDKIMQGIEGIFHEYERLKIFRRFQRGKLYKAHQGVIINGQALYGYKRINKTKEVPASYLLNTDEMAVVRMIFDWFGKERIPMRQIIVRLYKKGIMPRKQKQEFWTKGPIIRILQCKTYLDGKAHYNKSQSIPTKNPRIVRKYKRLKNGSRIVRPETDWIPFDVPRILDRQGDQELFENVQKMITHNKKYAPKKNSHNYLLTGIIHCECGLRRSGDGSSRYGHHYYRCVERTKTPINNYTCKSPGVNSDILDKDVWSRLEKYLKDPKSLQDYSRNWITSQQTDDVSDIEKQRILARLATIELEEERYQRAYGAGIMQFEQLEKLSKDIEKRKAVCNQQLSTISKPVKKARPKQEYINLIAREFKASVDELDFSSQKTTIRDTIDKVIIFGHKNVQVWGHIPLVNTHERLDSYAEDRNSRVTERWEINAF